MSATDGRDGVTFRVHGLPKPKGSWVAFWHEYLQRCQVKAQNSKDAEAWRKAIWADAKRANVPRLMTGPIRVRLIFYLPRAKSKKVRHHVYRDITPDVDKLERLVLDALTGTAWKDDKQVCDLHSTKLYETESEPTGALITVAPLDQTETLFDS